MPTFNPNEPQNGETVDADLLRNQFNALNDKVPALPIETDPVFTAWFNGGAVNLSTITNTSGAGWTRGSIDLTQQQSGGTSGGKVLVSAGRSDADLAGTVSIFGGNTSGASSGGNVYLAGGSGTVNHGGDVVLTGGPGGAAYRGGNIYFNPGPDNGGGLGEVHIGYSGGRVLTTADNVSVLANDAGYITAASIPTEVSAFANNAGYLTADNTADGTYPVANDGATSGQLASITIANGLITGVTVVP